MPILEIRRHAERSDLKNNESSLSPAGRAMAQALAKRTGPYTLVLSSPLPRAKETAQLIAGRLDGTDPGLLPEMGGIIGDRIFGEMRALADWAEVLREREDARQFAAAQLLTWARLAARIGEKERTAPDLGRGWRRASARRSARSWSRTAGSSSCRRSPSPSGLALDSKARPSATARACWSRTRRARRPRSRRCACRSDDYSTEIDSRRFVFVPPFSCFSIQ